MTPNPKKIIRVPEQPPGPTRRGVLALGSNIGDRHAHLATALDAIRAMPLTTVVAVSSAHETVALTLGGRDERAPAYLNCVALIDTRLDASVLLGYLQHIERMGGRVRSERWGDRTIDIDIITLGDVRVDDDALTIPHPRAAERDFVLDPWLEIDPDATLPGAGRVRDVRNALGEACR